ncbi:response regulator [Cupriavidus sp. a3]|uniref:response regulator n=1 Tax=Cupriavidus sp. a3 TaxID=3242158 RepID=UPI003D9C61C2
MPILILTARDNRTEKVEGIDAGADDYVAKPFRMEELPARICALIRARTAWLCRSCNAARFG